MVAVIYLASELGRTARATRTLEQLPRGARAVLRVDTKALRRSAAAQALIDAFVGEDRISAIEEVCGLDPIEDLSEVTLWVGGSEKQPFRSFGLMLTGRHVDATAIAECHAILVEARGGSVVRLEAPTGPVLASDDRRSAIARLDGHTVVTGSIGTVAETLAVQHGLLPKLVERPSIASLWPVVSSRAAMSAVIDPPSYWKAALERVTAFDADASALEGLEAIGLAVRPGPSRIAHVYIEAATEEQAANSADRIRAWSTLPPQNIQAPWDAVLRSAKVTVQGRRVLVRVDVSSLGPPL